MRRHHSTESPAVRKAEGDVRVIVALVGLLALVGGFTYWRLHSPKQITVGAAVDSSRPTNVDSAVFLETPVTLPGLNPSPISPESNAAPNATPQKPAPLATTARVEPTPESRQLVTLLSQLDVTHGPITAEQAKAWKNTLNQLTAQGQAAVPAIREFLQRHLNIDFEPAEADGSLGFSSLRLALLDTLQRIGGSEARDVALETLQSTVDPTEIAVLAKHLEKDDPQKYREEAVGAARAALNYAATAQGDGRDVAPLFDLLRNYAGANAIVDFEKYADSWFTYTPLVLAQLRDGAGVSSLIRLAKGAGGSASLGRDISQRMLAQVALQYGEAADALLEQAKADQIRTRAWPGVVSALTGSTLEMTRSVFDPTRSLPGGPGQSGFHVVMGNQNYTQNPPPANMTADEIDRRIQLIDSLLATTSNPAAIDNLMNARNTLGARLTPKN